jgi:hypothetical protein
MRPLSASSIGLSWAGKWTSCWCCETHPERHTTVRGPKRPLKNPFARIMPMLPLRLRCGGSQVRNVNLSPRILQASSACSALEACLRGVSRLKFLISCRMFVPNLRSSGGTFGITLPKRSTLRSRLSSRDSRFAGRPLPNGFGSAAL